MGASPSCGRLGEQPRCRGRRAEPASLVISTTTSPGRPPYVLHSLYTDTGEVYSTNTASELPGAVVRHDNLADAADTRVVAAARHAASGDLDAAREQMAQKVWDQAQAEPQPILLEKGVANPTPQPRPTGKALRDGINNRIWTNGLRALDVGAANAEVRAGVLRDGEPTLTLTAGPALFGGASDHILTINADTGLPIRSESRPAPGQEVEIPPSATAYQSSRVTVADIAAGKF